MAVSVSERFWTWWKYVAAELLSFSTLDSCLRMCMDLALFWEAKLSVMASHASCAVVANITRPATLGVIEVLIAERMA